jgi:hypothetical protein
MRLSSVILLPIIVSACVMSRPIFVEPKWGGAPPPLPSEVTEITWELRTCRSSCRDEEIVLRRDGRASRTFGNEKRVDSLFLATIDSVTFRGLVGDLVRYGLFAGADDDGSHEPLATSSVVMSVATLCRRRVASLPADVPRAMTRPQPQDVFASVAAKLTWTRCCRR